MSNSKTKKRSCLVAFITFLLSIVLIAALLLAIPITLMRYLLTDHNIEVIVDHVIDSIEIDKIEFETEGGTKNIAGIIFDATSEIEELNAITEEQINAMLQDDFVKQFVTDILKQYGLSLKEGQELLGWTPEQIYAFIEENREKLEQLAREAGYEGQIPIQENKEQIISNLESAIGTEGISFNSFIEENNDNSELTAILEKAQLIFSGSTFCLAWGIVAFVALLIFFLNIRFFGSFCRSCGFPAFIVGGLYFLLGLAVSPVLEIADISIPMLASVIDFTAGFAAALLMDISVIVLGIGLVLLIISLICNAVRRNIDSQNNK